MPYLFADAETLADMAPVGNEQCVTLVRAHTQAPASSTWSEGDHVRGHTGIAKGTVIATFVNGKYPNNKSGNHAAFYIEQNEDGLIVVDQWKGSGTIRKRLLSFKGKDENGHYKDPSNNGDAFSIVL